MMSQSNAPFNVRSACVVSPIMAFASAFALDVPGAPARRLDNVGTVTCGAALYDEKSQHNRPAAKAARQDLG
jgi:hypothetical protein